MSTPRVTVVGLGPGGEQHVTAGTLAEIARVPHRFVRTTVHPTAHLVGDARSFDDAYEAADTFDDVYAEITDRLVVAAAEHGEVLYAVPGSPLVLERTVRHLRATAGIECVVHPAMSFLDVAYARLDIDPVEEGVRLVDGHEFAVSAAGERGPLLVAHCHADWVLSDIKLAVDASGDEVVIILQRLGTPDELVTTTTWSELDRTVVADHLTSIYIPRLGVPVGQEYVRFHALARTLREQCPWDVEQTHRSLVPYLVEESHEVIDAIEALDPDDPTTDHALIEELGDLLYQVEFHATIAEQEGRFTIADVARGIHDKLVRRHPHVFGPTVIGTAIVETAEVPEGEHATATVLANWDEIKRAEKGRSSTFDGVPASLPALAYAQKVQRTAAKLGFDWPDVGGALPKIAEEAGELAAATDDAAGAQQIRDELGDLLFAVVNVARHLEVDAESALRAGTNKFRRRFEAVERLAAERGIDVATAGLDQLDRLWDEVKARTS